MALPELQQAQSILKRAGTILLLAPARPSVDAVASMVALYLTLQANKKGENIDAISPSHVPRALQFLPGSSQIKMNPETRSDVVLDLAGPQTIANIRQEPLSGGLRLHITLPEGVTITKDQIETVVRSLPYDAAIVFGAADLEELGPTFTQHADFFYNTPVINIDHRADNEYYGTVNLVDITASSVAEVTYELIQQLQPQPDATVATALYAGIVAGTDSFQKPSTTPHSFKMAADLIELKADREAVIRHLVKTKPLPLLKLLGRIYARLRFDEHIRLYWSILRNTDFEESGSTPDDLLDAIHELTNNIAAYNAVAILYEHEQRYELYVLLSKGLKQRRSEIQTMLSAQRENGLLRLPIPAQSLAEAEDKVLEKVRSILP